MAAGTEQQTQNFVTLKGSVDLIADFFSMSLLIAPQISGTKIESYFSRLQFE